ncbi:MAG TPA: chemotaxis protein CheW [Tepidisphaeraceae bacterium]|jgi:purine-binding chemotaxis protein CheW|nr:chemotaxis protein CheW [Tepidisphaeraceae bacterium]
MTISNTDILKARARSLARPSASAQSPDASIEVVEFRLAQELYAVEQRYVEEVLPLKDFTPLPGTPPFLPGIVNVRGKVLAVIDIKKFFGLPDAGIADLHAVIVVRVNDVEAGILADLVGGARSVPRATIQPPLPTLNGIRAAYLKGITAQCTAILDVPAILNDPAVLVDEPVQFIQTEAKGNES